MRACPAGPSGCRPPPPSRPRSHGARNHRYRPSVTCLSTLVLLLRLALLPKAAAYIPAVPINDSSSFTDSSSIAISWTDPPSVYSGDVSFELEADVPTGGTTSGALVHFSEATMGPNVSTFTPWIAYVSCDRNESGASMEWDIFTLARDRGAVSALLYTAQSASCLLNAEYISDFDKPLDVFATGNVQVARIIDNQWSHTNDSYYYFNSTLLNDSAVDVNSSLIGNAPPYRTYLIGTLTARNGTRRVSHTNSAVPIATGAASTKHGVSKSMLALYIIVGIIATAFILMICFGARRALRDPARNGQPDRDEEDGPQPRAGGLPQDILDTFPVTRFTAPNDQKDSRTPRDRGYSEDASYDATPKRVSSEPASSLAMVEIHDRDPIASYEYRPKIGYVRISPSVYKLTVRPMYTEKMADITIDTDGSGATCAICLTDYVEGDMLRQVQCDGKHVYHKRCIDLWFENQICCPLCRKDFLDSTLASPSVDSPNALSRYMARIRRQGRNTGSSWDRRHTTGAGANIVESVGRGRRREADQNGPGGY